MFLVNLYEIFRNNVSRYEEHLWKISLETNKNAKSYRVNVYVRQSAPGVFDRMTHTRRSAPCAFERMTHICVNQQRRC